MVDNKDLIEEEYELSLNAITDVQNMLVGGGTSDASGSGTAGEALLAAGPSETTNGNSPNVTQSETEAPSLSCRGKIDPAWEHVTMQIDAKTQKQVRTCIYCHKSWKGGGIHRMKEHLAKEKGNVIACDKVPSDVCHQMAQSLANNEKKKKDKELNDAYDHQTQTNEHVAPIQSPQMVSNKGKRKATDDSTFFAPTSTQGSQQTLQSAYSSKKAVHGAKMAIARWFFDSNIPFNATKSPYFQEATNAIASIGFRFKVPTYHDLRVNLLGDCKRECSLLVESYRSKWAKDDGDERPSMGYVYDGMQRAKNAIKAMFRNRKSSYKPYTDIIKARWDKHLKRELHAAAYFFNPAFQYSGDFNDKSRVTEALVKLFEVKSLCPDVSKAFQEMQMYRDRKDSFGKPSAVKVAANLQPAEWWKIYGGSAPILQKLAIRSLGQTSSSSGCERNWSVFERIHTKRRNRLEHQRLNDLVYVAYNLRLKNRSTPELDINEIENLLYHEDAIPIIESSLRNNQDDDDDEFGTMPFQVEEDNDVEVNHGGSNGEDAFIPSGVIFDYGETSFDEYNDV
ncbi:hypothetical protein QL285_046412 [Trifolium repens]|nr:hypothetical protein QL285_046412 [Trifolium repens]